MLVGRVAQLVADCGVAVSAGDPLEQLRQLAEADRSSRPGSSAARRSAATCGCCGGIAPAGGGPGPLETPPPRAVPRVRRRDEQEFRRRAVESARAEALRRDREALEREIAPPSASAAPGNRSASSWKAPRPRAWTRAAQEARARLAAIEGQLRERLEERGQIVEQMKALAEDRRLADKQLEAAVVEKRLEEAVRRWQVLAVTLPRPGSDPHRPTSTSGSRRRCARRRAIWTA